MVCIRGWSYESQSHSRGQCYEGDRSRRSVPGASFCTTNKGLEEVERLLPRFVAILPLTWRVRAGASVVGR